MKKVYICSSCRKENYDYVDRLLKHLNALNSHFIFRPQFGQLEDKERYNTIDAEAIRNCDELWLIGDYGRDCSWEIGYAAGLGKEVVVYPCPVNTNKLESDWMLWSQQSDDGDIKDGFKSFIRVDRSVQDFFEKAKENV